MALGRRMESPTCLRSERLGPIILVPQMISFCAVKPSSFGRAVAVHCRRLTVGDDGSP